MDDGPGKAHGFRAEEEICSMQEYSPHRGVVT